MRLCLSFLLLPPLLLFLLPILLLQKETGRATRRKRNFLLVALPVSFCFLLLLVFAMDFEIEWLSWKARVVLDRVRVVLDNAMGYIYKNKNKK